MAVPKRGRYLSGDENLRFFAAGSPSSKLSVEVLWRSGQRSFLEKAEPGFLYEMSETKSKPAAPPNTIPQTPWFADATAQLAPQLGKACSQANLTYSSSRSPTLTGVLKGSQINKRSGFVNGWPENGYTETSCL